jgi:hypothetical protein
MSLLGSIGGALKGAIGGFSSGGFLGAGMGAVQGAQAAKPNKARGRGQGYQLAAMRGQAVPATAPFLTRSLVGLPSTNTYSASAPVASGGFTWSPSGPMSTLGFSATKATWGSRRQPAGGFDANGWPLKANGHPYKKYRSMNPLNGRAARRAIRRIKGARKMLMQIERQLPKARTHHTRRASR